MIKTMKRLLMALVLAGALIGGAGCFLEEDHHHGDDDGCWSDCYSSCDSCDPCGQDCYDTCETHCQ